MKDIIEIKTSYADRYVKNYILPSKDYYILIDSGIVSSWNETYQKINSVPNFNKNIQLVIINTHEHWDHIGLNSILLKELNALIVAHKAGIKWMEDYKYQFQQSFEAFSPELVPDIKTKQDYWREIGIPVKVQICLTGSEIFKNNKYELEVIHTPGHSPGSICLFEKQKGLLFSGDTIQGGGFFGRLPLYSNVTCYINSLEKLKSLSPCTILGGHTPLIDGTNDVQQILDKGIQTIESVGKETRIALNKITSNQKLSDIVKEVCKELNTSYSIHAFFSVLAHINNMVEDIPIAADFVNRYIKQKNLTLYLESRYE